MNSPAGDATSPDTMTASSGFDAYEAAAGRPMTIRLRGMAAALGAGALAIGLQRGFTTEGRFLASACRNGRL